MQGRNVTIDLAKFIFSIIIVIYHSILLTDQRYIPLFQRGYIVVEFFFIVSGYLMAASASRNSDTPTNKLGTETAMFIFRKVKILFLYYIIAWVISFVVVHCGYRVTLDRIVKDGMNAIWPFFFANMSGLDGFETVAATWYISAMLIVMFIIYPVLRAKNDLFIYAIAPALTIFIYGYLSKTFNGTPHPYKWLNIFGFGTYAGILRAIAGLSLGCTCFGIVKKIETVHITQLLRVLLTIMEISAYITSLLAIQLAGNSRSDYLVVLAFAIAATLSFSNLTLTGKLFGENPARYLWMSNLSLAFYLCHGRFPSFTKRITANLNNISTPDLYWQRFAIYAACVTFASFGCVLCVAYIRQLLKKHGNSIKKALIQ